MKFLGIENCTDICVLVQDDVAERIVANVGTKEYGALSVTCQAMATCKIVKHVPRNLFRPVPNVDSAFVRLTKHSPFNEGGGIDSATIKRIFSQRRKKISNSVGRDVLSKCGIDPDLRPEQLTVMQFVKICQNIL
jgi:16S rRNA (adenine1518-N6/adenine1519-N6)-dimethyltransferase